MFDSAGRLRFQLDARGAAAPTPYISYWKYDARSRVVEEGCVAHAWPGDLADHVDDQSYPTATASNLYVYDFVPGGDPTDLLTFNKLVTAISQNQVSDPSQNDPFVATESFTYDIWEDVIGHQLQLGGGPAPYVTSYEFDNQGDTSAIQYPTDAGPRVEYHRDWTGRVDAVQVAGRRVLALTYDRNGGLATEAMYADSGQPVGQARTYAYAPPGWPSSTVGSQFSETTDYAPGAYNGSPSRVVTAARGPRAEVVSRYGYDPTGRLDSIDPGDGIARAARYDDNGNLVELMDSTNGYSAAGKDRVQTRTDVQTAVAYHYDAGGDQTSRTGTGLPLTAAFDCFRDRPLSVQAGPVVAQTRYGLGARRVQKTVGTAAKLYLRGAGDDVLVERVVGGGDIVYIRGPRGLAQLRGGGATLYVATDRLGSVRAVLDEQAALIAGYDYLPYGAANGAPLGSDPGVTPYRFQSREQDESGLYDFRARLYDVLQGRFVSPDPRHQDDSPYLFSQDNPLVYTDPNGEFAFLIALFAALAEVAEEIAVATAVGAAVGFVGGVASGAVAASQVDDPGEAAGVFFGTLVLSTAAGALSGAAGAATGAFIEGVSVTSAVAVSVGAVAQGGIAAAQSVGQAALTGGDLGDAAWKNLVAGTVASLAGQAASSLAKIPLERVASLSALKGTTKAVISGAASGAAGGATGAATDDLLYGDDESTTLSNVLQGIAWGVLGGIVPEVADYKVKKARSLPERRLRQVRIDMENAIGNEDL
jgi:RHS repeat-associated protein